MRQYLDRSLNEAEKQAWDDLEGNYWQSNSKGHDREQEQALKIEKPIPTAWERKHSDQWEEKQKREALAGTLDM